MAKISKIAIILVYGFYFSNATNSERNASHPMHLGEPFHFVCPEHHKGKSNFYHYNSTTEQYQLVYNDSYRFQTTIKSLHNAGTYCCSRHHGETLPIHKSHYCIQVEVPTIIQWNLPASFHGDINGSCTLTGNPAPTGDLVEIHDCEYQSSVTIVDEYTVIVNFTIYNPTQSCHIYCHSINYEEKKVLPISTPVMGNSTNTTNSSSPILPTNKPTTTSTQIPSTTFSYSWTTFILPSTAVSKTLPTYFTGTSTDTDSNKIQNGTTTDVLKMMLIIVVIMVSILTIITVATLILVIRINMREHNSSKTEP